MISLSHFTIHFEIKLIPSLVVSMEPVLDSIFAVESFVRHWIRYRTFISLKTSTQGICRSVIPQEHAVMDDARIRMHLIRLSVMMAIRLPTSMFA